jgi:hypothetical protein
MINFIKTNKSTKGSPIIPNIAYWITFMTHISKLLASLDETSDN